MMRDLAHEPLSTADLMSRYDVTERTVKRMIAEARHLGADIGSERRGRRYVWRVRNWPAIERITTRWIELEERRDLRAGARPREARP